MDALDFYGESWEKIGNFDDEIISVFTVVNLLTKLLLNIDFEQKIVADYGCGIGNALPYLLKAKQIYAIDTSCNLLSKAKESFKENENITFRQHSIATVKTKKADISLAINSLWPRTFEEFDILFDNIVKNTKEDGKIFLVLPSLEARTLFFQFDFVYLKQDKCVQTIKALETVNNNQAASHFNALGYLTSNTNMVQKHWLKEEIFFRLKRYDFYNIKISKLELEWDKQVHMPHMKNYPKIWFWLIEIDK